MLLKSNGQSQYFVFNSLNFASTFFLLTLSYVMPFHRIPALTICVRSICIRLILRLYDVTMRLYLKIRLAAQITQYV